MFLRVYELKEKFRYVIKQAPEKNKVLRELSSCVIEKFNGFSVVRVEFGKKLRQSFHPIDIIYKPVKRCDEIIDCFFSEKLNLTFCTSFSEGVKIKHSTACNAIFVQNILVGKTDLIDTLKIVPVILDTFTI